ncbi:hypothetical protein ILYODFUR_005164, partial [Ilyodon furcidens]
YTILDGSGHVKFCVDASKPDAGSWLKHIQFAPAATQHNLRACQIDDQTETNKQRELPLRCPRREVQVAVSATVLLGWLCKAPTGHGHGYDEVIVKYHALSQQSTMCCL